MREALRSSASFLALRLFSSSSSPHPPEAAWSPGTYSECSASQSRDSPAQTLNLTYLLLNPRQPGLPHFSRVGARRPQRDPPDAFLKSISHFSWKEKPLLSHWRITGLPPQSAPPSRKVIRLLRRQLIADAQAGSDGDILIRQGVLESPQGDAPHLLGQGQEGDIGSHTSGA